MITASSSSPKLNDVDLYSTLEQRENERFFSGQSSLAFANGFCWRWRAQKLTLSGEYGVGCASHPTQRTLISSCGAELSMDHKPVKFLSSGIVLFEIDLRDICVNNVTKLLIQYSTALDSICNVCFEVAVITSDPRNLDPYRRAQDAVESSYCFFALY